MSRNALFAYMAAAVSAVAPILAMPVIAGRIGAVQWGYVSAGLLVGLLALIVEQGITQSISAHVARLMSHAQDAAMDLLHKFSLVYGGIGLLASILIASCVLFTSESWRDNGLLEVLLVAVAVIPFQFLASIRRGFMLAAELHLQNSVVVMLAMVIRHGGGVLVAYAYKSAVAYFLWQCIALSVDALLRGCLLKFFYLGDRVCRQKIVPGGWGSVRTILTDSIKTGAASTLGSAAVYLDRYLVALMMPSTYLGYYTIASTAAVGSLQAIYPLVQIFMPKIARAGEGSRERYLLNMALFKRIVIVVAFAAIGYFIFGEYLIEAWLSDVDESGKVAQLLNFLLIGSALNAMFNVGFVNWLVDGKRLEMLKAYLIAVVFALPIASYLMLTLGVSAAPSAWVVLNLLCFVFSLSWLKKRV